LSPLRLEPSGVTQNPMSFLTHSAFSIMLLLALLAGYWGHQRATQRGF
jgi:hypothetical protein